MDAFTIENFWTLLMLLMLQAVLGFDNLLYISIESKRVKEESQAMVRRLGIGLAVGRSEQGREDQEAEGRQSRIRGHGRMFHSKEHSTELVSGKGGYQIRPRARQAAGDR